MSIDFISRISTRFTEVVHEISGEEEQWVSEE
jgi:hypothetical protein